MNGPVGLDYGVLFAFMERLPVAADEWLSVVDDVRIMESEALTVMREDSE